MHRSRLLVFLTTTSLAIATLACLPGGSGTEVPATSTPESDVQDARFVPTVQTSAATPSPSATALPVLPSLSTYIVQSGDYPTLIAEFAGVPAEERDAWIHEMLALNNTDATSLQIGQELILPPLGDGSAPVVVRPETQEAAPPAAALEPAITPTSTPAGDTRFAGGIPFAATPPRLGFPTETPTPTATTAATPTATPSPTAIPTGQRAWLTSTYEEAKYYYCDLDAGWHAIPAEHLQAFDSEQQLLAVWGRFRTKVPGSAC